MSKPTQRRQQRKNKSAKDRVAKRARRCATSETWPVSPVAVFQAAEQLFLRGPDPKAPTSFRFSVPLGLGKVEPTGEVLKAFFPPTITGNT